MGVLLNKGNARHEIRDKPRQENRLEGMRLVAQPEYDLRFSMNTPKS
jgi:hypothetical protein